MLGPKRTNPGAVGCLEERYHHKKHFPEARTLFVCRLWTGEARTLFACRLWIGCQYGFVRV